jgi:hypothetical protein
MFKKLFLLIIVLCVASNAIPKELEVETAGTISAVNLLFVTSMSNSQQMTQEGVTEIKLKEFPANSYQFTKKNIEPGNLEIGQKIVMTCSTGKRYDFLKGEQKYFNILSLKVLGDPKKSEKKTKRKN